MSKGAIPPVTPPGTETARRCFEHPDTPLWRAAIRGVLARMTYKYHWDLSGLTPSEADEFMAQCRDIYYSLEDNCTDEGCDMDCNEVIDCIVDNASDPRLIDAIGDIWAASDVAADIRRAIDEAAKISATEITAPGGTDCPQRVYNTAREMFARLANDVTDFLEQVEVQSNAAELSFTLVGLVAGASSVGIVTEFISNAQDNLLEVFEAEVTDEFIDNLACDFYGLYANRCAISPDDFLAFFASKLSQPTFSDLTSALASLAGFMLATNPLYAIALMATALVAAKFGAVKISSPFGQYQVSPGAMRRYLSLIEIAMQTPAIIPSSCNPNATFAVRGERYRVNGGPWVDIQYATFGVPVDLPRIYPLTVEVEDTISGGYIVTGTCGVITTPRYRVTSTADMLVYDTDCNYVVVTAGDEALGRRFDWNGNTGTVAVLNILGEA